MKVNEILRLVWINLIQNKFKVILTSIGIVVGAATIMMVIAIGRGGQKEVEEQFKNLNAGAIDISYEMSSELSSLMDSVKTSGGRGFRILAAVPKRVVPQHKKDLPVAVCREEVTVEQAMQMAAISVAVYKAVRVDRVMVAVRVAA